METTNKRERISDSNSKVKETDISYTSWSNNRLGRHKILQRLDRSLINIAWASKLNTSISHLHRNCSDHAPLLVNIKDRRPTGSAFRYINVWANNHTFLQEVASCWTQPQFGRPMVRFAQKLKALRKTLKVWNRCVFGNIHNAVSHAEDEVLRAEFEYDHTPSEYNMKLLCKAKQFHNEKLELQECFWKQKVNIKWLKEGDKNTRFFHHTVKVRRQKLSLHRIRGPDNEWITDQSDIAQAAVAAFQTQLNGKSTIINEDLLSHIPKIISEEQNKIFELPPTLEEVYEVVKVLSMESTAGPDWFNGHFYVTCWNIIRHDLHEAIVEFFSGQDIPKAWTSTTIVPIPKVANPESFKELRPISLCNFNCKVLSKLIAARLSSVLPSIISANQGGFVQGRNIFDNILLAQELSQSINKKVRGKNVILKLHMHKAYDTIKWLGLLKIMRSFGFGEVCIDMVYRLISNCNYSVLINGQPSGFFSNNRGIRQGDPLSPYLFIIA